MKNLCLILSILYTCLMPIDCDTGSSDDTPYADPVISKMIQILEQMSNKLQIIGDSKKFQDLVLDELKQLKRNDKTLENGFAILSNDTSVEKRLNEQEKATYNLERSQNGQASLVNSFVKNVTSLQESIVSQNNATAYLEQNQNGHASLLNSLVNNVTSLQESIVNHENTDKEQSREILSLTDQLDRMEVTVMENRKTVKRLERMMTYNLSTIPIAQELTESLKSEYKRNVRLVDGRSSSGRLEVNIGGTWGNVCDDSFNNTDASVVCRQLGYSRGAVRSSAFYGQGSLSIIMDDVNCFGNEWAIQSCEYIKSHNCDHSEDVGVACY